MEVIILVIMGIFLIPIVNLYYWAGIFLIPAGAAITAYILAGKDKSKVKNLDLVNIILAFVAIIPIVGYLCRIASIILAIIALVKINQE